MKPNEVMIGDWVYNKHHKKNIRLTAYDFFTHRHDKETNEQYLNENSKPAKFLDKEPIPLTEEILKMNGFEKHATYKGDTDNAPETIYWMWYDYKVEVVTENNVAVSIRFFKNCDDDGYDVLYLEQKDVPYSVHELQHTFRICGLNELANNFKVE